MLSKNGVDGGGNVGAIDQGQKLHQVAAGVVSSGLVVASSLSLKKGTVKNNVPIITVDQFGVVGDAHAGSWHRQVSLLSVVSIDAFNQRTGKKINCGEFGENISFVGIDAEHIGILDQLKISDVLLEVTQIGKECHGDGCTIFREVGKCIMPQEGLFARVLHGGKIVAGDTIHHTPYILKILVITLSDRAAAGVYEDKAGEIARQMLAQFFATSSSRWHWQLDSVILPDDVVQLNDHLQVAVNDGVDIILTLGGTGVGVRDITPETVGKVCNKLIPGIMENIRLKYGSSHPSALLSRGVAGIAGVNNKTQIYTLPGSVRAVNEYLMEIFKTLEHVILMLHGIDRH